MSSLSSTASRGLTHAHAAFVTLNDETVRNGQRSPLQKSSVPAYFTSSPSNNSERGKKRRKSTHNNSSSKSAKHKKSAPLTTSFQPVWSGRFDDVPNETPVHTLILGTHPSIKSFEEHQYFGHAQNAFWWIAGDCLGFRRAAGVSPSTGKPYAIATHVRYGHDQILSSYEEQQKVLVRHGFALWDIVGQCRRPGSLDQDIFDERPNQLRQFAEQHRRTLKRIVFANGGTGCAIFNKHFKEWLGSGELEALPGHDPSEKAFSKAIAREESRNNNIGSGRTTDSKIQLFCAIGVSPAAASYSYVQKRESWEKYVYEPGLKDFEALQNDDEQYENDQCR
jgi:double-stranded uracil-DNA glycosylase